MEQIIWKESLPPRPGKHTIVVPTGAYLLSAREQGKTIAIWFRCDPNAAPTELPVTVCITGGDAKLPYPPPRLLGTCIFDGGAYVVHVFA